METARQPTSGSLYLVMFLAGFTFLVYEVGWNRHLSLVLGTTVTAATIVLATFMAGLGTGAYFWGRRARNESRSPILLSSLLAGIGLFNVLAYILVTRLVPRLYTLPAGGGMSQSLLEFLIFAFCAVLLFMPTFLMGGILPLVSHLAIRSDRAIPSMLGRLYALETLGSTLGGLLTGFVLLGTLGQQHTLTLAAALNLALAGWVALVRRTQPAGQESGATRSAGSSPQLTGQESPTDRPRSTARSRVRKVSQEPRIQLRRTALIGAFICGFAILGLQVLWFRIFRIYLANTSYTFALVSSLAILGLFTGSALFARQGRNVIDPQRDMFRILLFMGGMTGLGLLVLVYLPQFLMFPFQALLGSPFARVVVMPGVAALLIVFPPALFSGYAFPLACSMYTAGRDSVGRDVGFVLMINTLGSVLGPVVAAFILLTLLGVGRSIVLLIMLLIGAALHIRRRRETQRRTAPSRFWPYVAPLLLVLATLLLPAIRILPPSFSRFDREVLFYRESVEGTLSVGKDRGTRTEARYTFVNNSAVIGSTYDAVKVVKMVGHFPFFLGLECRDVLVIGFGIGVTTAAIAAHPEVESIACVELVAGLKDAAAYYQDLNRNVIADPRLKFIAGDGRHYLQMTPDKYDLISCDPTHPALGSGNLYTREYFALCRAHLKPGGMVSQYLPLHKLRTEDFLGLIATFHTVFPHSTVWLGHYHAVLLGSLEPMTMDFADWAANVASIGQDRHLYVDPYHFAATLMLDGPAIAKLAVGSRINTDDRSYTEFFAPGCLAEDNLGKNLRFLMESRTETVPVFTNIEDQARMERFVQGNQLLTESLYHKLGGDEQRSLALLRRACQVNPEDREFPFLIRLYY